MTPFVIREENGSAVVSRDGRECGRFPITEDLPECCRLIEQLSHCRTAGGKKVFEAWERDGTYFWPLYLEGAFWHLLRPLVKYRRLLEWLADQPAASVESQVPDLDNVLRALGLAAGARADRAAGWRQWVRDRADFLLLAAHNLAVILWLRVAGIRGLLFAATPDPGSNRNFRLRDICRQLEKDHVPHLHAFVFEGFKHYFSRLRRFREPVFYFPHNNRVYPSLLPPLEARPRVAVAEWAAFDPWLARFLPGIVEWVGAEMGSTMAGVPFTRWLLRLSGIRWIAGIDDHTAHVVFLPACRQLGIETIAVQTGPFRRLNIGWIAPGIPATHCMGYDRFLVWSEYWRGVLLRMSNVYASAQLIACGHIRPGSLALTPRGAGPPHAPLRILYAWEFLADPAEVGAYLRAMLDRGLEVWFKLRPDTPRAEQLQALPGDRLRLLEQFDAHILQELDVCAGTFTTVMYELAHLGLPLWYLPMRHDHGHAIAADGLAREVTLADLRQPDFDPLADLPPPAAVFGNVPAPEYLSRHLK